MPKQLAARPPLAAREERQVRKLAHSIHAPVGWILHAQMVARSWDGLRTTRSPTASPVTAVAQFATGWTLTRASSTPSSRSAPPG